MKYPGLNEDVIIGAELVPSGGEDGGYVIDITTPDFTTLLDEQNYVPPPVEEEAEGGGEGDCEEGGEGRGELVTGNADEDDDIDIRPIDDPESQAEPPQEIEEGALEASVGDAAIEGKEGEAAQQTQEPDENIDPNILCISVLLDGMTYPPKEFVVKLALYEAVVLEPPHAPKGGFLCAGSTDVEILARGLPMSCDSAVIRIRGEGGDPIDIVGTVNEDFTSITIQLPDEGLGNLEPEVRNKKEHWYFIDCCLDGTHFDESEEATLNIK
jgi:hypothetical protein